MSSIPKKSVDAFIRKAHRFLDCHSDKIEVKRIREYIKRNGKKFIPGATYNPANRSITIDYRHCFLDGLVHEFLHHLNPKWTEKEVKNMESKILNGLSDDQAIKLIKHLATTL